MEFDYVVKRYSFSAKEEKVLGGFVNLNAAKGYAERKYFDNYLTPGYCLIEAPEGKYILGCDERESFGYTTKWYNPGEKAVIYEPRLFSRAIHLDELQAS